MALKDLVVDSGAVTEKAIEEIVSGYVKYEVDPQGIVFTPAGNALGNAEKVIVYFAAVVGWKYVVDEPPFVSTKPADLEDAIGIGGGTLRPVLKKLKDNHILVVADRHYSIRASNLAAAARIVNGVNQLPASHSKSKGKKSGNPSGAADAAARVGVKSKKKAGVPIKASLEALLDEGFFGEFRTLGQIVERFHELAINAKVTSLSGPVADMVRDKKLERKRADEKGNKVWAYRASRD